MLLSSGTTPRARPAFTLLEVVVAMAILGLSLGLLLQLIGGARERLFRAEQRWTNQHLLAQAAELCLLAGPDAESPPGLLPQGFATHCTLLAADNLPDTATTEISGWILGKYEITLTGPGGEKTGSLTVERVVRQDDLGK